MQEIEADTIQFSEPLLSEGNVKFVVNHGIIEDILSFSVPPDFHCHPDLFATSLATLCGRRFRRIEFGFAISEKAAAAISAWTGSTIRATGTVEPRRKGSRIALNFSGGFDSLAAYFLAPDEQLRCAVDFGGQFGRECDFFTTLAPDIVCKTDIRSKGYDRQSWMFMGAPSLLLADYLNLEAIGYGTNFESSLWHYHTQPDFAPKSSSNQLLRGVDLYDSTVLRGLTGFGVARILKHYAPALVPLSLRSLAAEGSIKRVRKTIVYASIEYVSGGGMPRFDQYTYPKGRHKIGQDYTEDFFAILLSRLYGKSIVSRWMEGLDAIDDMDLGSLNINWAFKFNPIFESYMPHKLQSIVRQRLEKAKVETFSSDDWFHYRAFRRILEQFHKFPVK